MQPFLLSVAIAISILVTFQTCYGVDQTGVYPCGEPGGSLLEERITHGWNADSSMWPWHAAIFRRGNNTNDYICGATLIGQFAVVTAAHCVINRATGHKLNPNLFTVHLGRQYLNESSERVQEIAVNGVVTHPQFMHGSLTNDIALLSLKTPVQFNEYVLPICLDKLDSKIDDLVGREGAIVGWGKTESGHVSMSLQTARLPIIDYIACLNSDPLFYSQLISYGMFCAGYENGTSVCNGDSGSGMFFREGEKWVLRGIVSFSALKADRISCDFHKYAGFTNVRYYIPWIQTITKDSISLMDASNPSEIGILPKIHSCIYEANTPLACQLSNVHLAQGSTVSFYANNTKPTIIAIRRSYLQFLPKSLIDAFPAMEYLNLQNLRIRNIEPNAFETAANVLSINVQMNRLEEISRNTFSGARSLMQLNLSYNQIKFVDELALSSISRMENFDVSNNRITHLPAFNNNKRLESVNASHNLLTEVSEDHFFNNSRLRVIDIANNRLTHLDLRQLDASSLLNTIDLSFNQLKRLHIPQHVRHLLANNNSVENVSAGACAVKTLNLAANKLQSLLDISNCTSLEVLDLSSNLLQSFSFELTARMPRLQNLYLSNNRILEIDPPSSKNFRSRLEVLDLSHNLIIHIPSYSSFRRLVTVKLNHNELLHLDFSKTNQLQEAYLSSNQWDCSVLQNIRVKVADRDPDSCKEGFRKSHGICCKDYGDMFAEITRNEYIHNLSAMNSLKDQCLTLVSNTTIDRQTKEFWKIMSNWENAKNKKQADLNATFQVRFELSTRYETINASYQSLKEKTSAISSVIKRQLKLVNDATRDANKSDSELLQEILESMENSIHSSNILLEQNRHKIMNLPYRKQELKRAIQELHHIIRTTQQNLRMLEQEERHLKTHHDGLARILQHRNSVPNRPSDSPSNHRVYPPVGGYSVSQGGGFPGSQVGGYRVNSQSGGYSSPQGGFYSEHNYHYEHHTTNIG